MSFFIYQSDSDIEFVKSASSGGEGQAVALRSRGGAHHGGQGALPPHLLMISLLEQLCAVYTTDNSKAQQLFKSKTNKDLIE